MLIDSHSHLNFKAYADDLEEVITRTLNENVWIINIGSKYDNSKKAVQIAQNYKEGVYAAIGLHPIHLAGGFFKIKKDTNEQEGDETSGDNFDMEKYKELAKSSNKVVAIGEIGLDYYYRPKTKKKIEEFKSKQKEVLIKQLELAEELNLPVIFHCRMAHQDLIEILSSRLKTQSCNLRGVIHCFTGSLQEAEEYIKLGFYIGLNGIIFKLNLDEVIKSIHLDRILIETDCPYLAPPEAGPKDMRNEPIFVKYVAERIAELKGVDYEEVAEITTKNTKNLFRI